MKNTLYFTVLLVLTTALFSCDSFENPPSYVSSVASMKQEREKVPGQSKENNKSDTRETEGKLSDKHQLELMQLCLLSCKMNNEVKVLKVTKIRGYEFVDFLSIPDGDYSSEQIEYLIKSLGKIKHLKGVYLFGRDEETPRNRIKRFQKKYPDVIDQIKQKYPDLALFDAMSEQNTDLLELLKCD